MGLEYLTLIGHIEEKDPEKTSNNLSNTLVQMNSSSGHEMVYKSTHIF